MAHPLETRFVALSISGTPRESAPFPAKALAAKVDPLEDNGYPFHPRLLGPGECSAAPRALEGVEALSCR